MLRSWRQAAGARPRWRRWRGLAALGAIGGRQSSRACRSSRGMRKRRRASPRRAAVMEGLACARRTSCRAHDLSSEIAERARATLGDWRRGRDHLGGRGGGRRPMTPWGAGQLALGRCRAGAEIAGKKRGAGGGATAPRTAAGRWPLARRARLSPRARRSAAFCPTKKRSCEAPPRPELGGDAEERHPAWRWESGQRIAPRRICSRGPARLFSTKKVGTTRAPPWPSCALGRPEPTFYEALGADRRRPMWVRGQKLDVTLAQPRRARAAQYDAARRPSYREKRAEIGRSDPEASCSPKCRPRLRAASTPSTIRAPTRVPTAEAVVSGCANRVGLTRHRTTARGSRLRQLHRAPARRAAAPAPPMKIRGPSSIRAEKFAAPRRGHRARYSPRSR